MKIILSAGLFMLLTLGLFYGNASAESVFPSKCTQFGAIQPNENPSFQHVNCLLTNAALEKGIPPEVVKAVASQENGWKQFDVNGQPIVSADGGIGLMQVTNQPSYDQDKLKTDIYYNIEKGVEVLSSMYDRTDLPKIKGADRQVIENWYFPVMAYNGTKPVNSPLVQPSTVINTGAYQEKVFTLIVKDSFLGDTKLGQFPFKTSDFEYNPNSDENIKFLTKEYTLTGPLHTSSYFFKNGEKVTVTKDDVNVRPQPDSPASGQLAKNTTLIINGSFTYNKSLNSPNQFVWYPFKTVDQKVSGFISSAYIKTFDPCTQYHKGQIIYWDGVVLKPGQLGRLTVLQNTTQFKLDGSSSLPLKKSTQPYRIYAFKDTMLSVGGGYYVDRNPAIVKYETPSKDKLIAVKCIADMK
ncbi:transglycosylase SLT domain-containing protein [Neobacillus sp. PS3-40]|uniref:transglycosylase SLT domain-containing protein n=1 Tax=Neobacillus sp. PS3-40 TaxID=3070679 RepID=UPI0027DF9057|nr:transglycosylase SLT domain-containing protein [Neobacillus sp. PS3-40]WML46193.1 transglycosylase SLT domain-containing protein [Neobacillus sp. PS3-40]